MNAKHSLCLSLLSCLLVGSAQAALTMTFTETGVNETTLVVTGTYDVSGNDELTAFDDFYLWDSFALSFLTRTTTADPNQVFVGVETVTGTIPLSNVTITSANSTIVDNGYTLPIGFYFDNDIYEIYGPSGFTAGDTIQTFTVVIDASYASLGYSAGDTGSFAYSGGQAVNWAFTPVPEPETYALIAGLGLMAFAGLRRVRFNRKA